MANPSPGFARNPDRLMNVTPHPGEVVVAAGGREIARSSHVLALREATYPVVFYVPFADIDFSALEKSASSTHCPYKGDASYWSVKDGPMDAMWAYETPYDEMLAIKDHGAFYPDRVSIEA